MSYFHLEVLKQFLTVKETAFVLNVSVDTVYKLIHTKALTAKKISPEKPLSALKNYSDILIQNNSRRSFL